MHNSVCRSCRYCKSAHSSLIVLDSTVNSINCPYVIFCVTYSKNNSLTSTSHDDNYDDDDDDDNDHDDHDNDNYGRGDEGYLI